MTKWWLISDDDVTVIRDAFQSPGHEANSFNCNPMPGEKCGGCEGERKREKALHILESGLNLTDAIPADWEEKP